MNFKGLIMEIFHPRMKFQFGSPSSNFYEVSSHDEN